MRIGILCAIPKEIHFFDLLPDSAQLVGGRTFFKSKHSSHDLVVVECGRQSQCSNGFHAPS